VIAHERLAVRDVLARRAASDGDAVFIRFETETASYHSVHQRAGELAAALSALGMERNELIALMLPNSIGYVETYFGAAYAGAAVVLVNTAFRGYMLEYVLNDAAPRLLVADASYLDTLLESEPNLTRLETIVVPTDNAAVGEWAARFSRVKVLALADVEAAGGRRSVPAPEVTAEDMHCVVYSSGTTGPSKGIMISNGHALTKAEEVLRICGFTAADTLYSPLPLFYSMGLLRGVLSVALAGSSIALRDRFSASAFWDDVRIHGATVAHCVFSIPKMLAQAPASARDLDNPLRCMFNAQHDPALEARFGVRLVESYGLTEAGNAIYNRLSEPALPGSCGRIADDWEVRLADPRGVEVPLGETGEILLRPRNPTSVMLGYLNKPEATAAAFRDLWLHTGDLARLDESGHYFYQGRIKDVIRRRGQNISAWEVEEILRAHPGVADVAALAEPSEVGEDDLRVVLVARADVTELDLADVAGYCERRMPAFMVPRYYEAVDELPRTPSGRVEKYKLEEVTSAVRFDRGGGGRR
jgi:crotonobetaine/carnitine-CoA ligase